MPLTDVSNVGADAQASKMPTKAPAKAFVIPGLTKPAPVAQAKEAKGKAAKETAAKASKETAKAPARAARKRAPAAKKEVTLTTTPTPPNAKRGSDRGAAKENAEPAEAAAPDQVTPEATKRTVSILTTAKTPGMREPKTPHVSIAGVGDAPPTVRFAEPEPEPEPEPAAADGRRTRGSRRANHAPKRFGEFTEWDAVQKGTLGTPGHGLQMGRLIPSSEDSSSSSGDAPADPSTARFAAASSDATVREVHERVQALMKMADAALPLEEGGGNDETEGKSLREALSESWNGQGYYAKLMAQMATPKGKGAKPEEEAHASGSGSGGAKKGSSGGSSGGSARSQPEPEVAMPSLAQVTAMFSAALPNLAAGARPAPVVLGKGKRTTHFAEDAEVPAMPAAAAPPPAAAAPLAQPAVAREGARKVAGKEAPVSASTSSSSRRAKKSAEETDASTTPERKIEALEAELAAVKSELEAAKGEIETLHADSSLAERESESLQNTLDTQTAQLRSKDAENKALKAELAKVKAVAAEAMRKMAAALNAAADAAEKDGFEA
jgi:hypothetical protein